MQKHSNLSWDAEDTEYASLAIGFSVLPFFVGSDCSDENEWPARSGGRQIENESSLNFFRRAGTTSASVISSAQLFRMEHRSCQWFNVIVRILWPLLQNFRSALWDYKVVRVLSESSTEIGNVYFLDPTAGHSVFAFNYRPS